MNGTRSDLQRYVNAITPTAKNEVNFIKFHFQAKVTKECYRVGKVKDKHQDYIRNGYGGGTKKPLVVHGGKIRELRLVCCGRRVSYAGNKGNANDQSVQNVPKRSIALCMCSSRPAPPSFSVFFTSELFVVGQLLLSIFSSRALV